MNKIMQHINKKVLVASLIASIVMAMMEMVYEWLFGVGFWAAPTFITATILRDLQAVAVPVPFLFWPVVLGILAHMMLSVILGVVFVAAMKNRLSSQTTSMLYGATFGIVIFGIMWFVLLPLIDPVMLALNPYVFALAHIVWGIVLGAMVVRSRSPQTA